MRTTRPQQSRPRQAAPAPSPPRSAPAVRPPEHGADRPVSPPATGWDFSTVPVASWGGARPEPGRPAATPVPPVQARLTLGTPGDAYEHEADRVADRVTALRGEAGSPGSVQRGADAPGRVDGMIRASAAAAGLRLSPAAHERVDRARSEPGQPLPESTRAFMEPRFGQDFSSVRVHADGHAAASAAAIGARAYTVGRDIVFGPQQYRPATPETRWLLAHELTHVVQQSRGAAGGLVQADFAVEPTHPDATGRTLSAAEIQAAITFNSATVNDPAEISMLRDILGLADTPAVIDADFVQAVAAYQAQYGLTSDGKIGPATRRRLSREILAEARVLGFADLGGLATGVALRTDLAAMIAAGNTIYADYRTRIRAATVMQRDVILAEPAFLTRLRNHLTTWDDFARCVELLGRRAPTFNQLRRDPTVAAALAAAWTDSTPGPNPPAGTQHEEGGWAYLNLITNRISIRRAPAGAGAALDLTAPPIVADSIVVAKFHTHPNLGPLWDSAPSAQDARVDALHGVPDLVVGTPGVNPAVFDVFASGPDRRLHLAGPQGLPGAAGGLAPQARADGTYDEQ